MHVTIYSTTNCAACNTLTQWLDQRQVPYTKKVTDSDEDIMAEFMNVNDGMIGVPFSVVTDDSGNETKISGYVPKKFIEALKLN